MNRIGGSITRVWSQTFMQIIKKKDYFKKINIFYLEEFQIHEMTRDDVMQLERKFTLDFKLKSEIAYCSAG